MLQQFGIANGEKLDITEDPTPRGRIGIPGSRRVDAGRNFLPAPAGDSLHRPSGPRCAVTPVETGFRIGGQF